MNNVKRIQQELRRRGLDGVLVTDEKNQRYASGFPITDGAVVVGLEKSWLITDSRYIEAAEAAVDGSLTEVVLYDREHPLTVIIRGVCSGMARLAAEDKKLSHAGYLGYEKALGRELLPAGDMFETLRASKSEEEIACMIEAQRISEKALETVLHIIKPGMTEKQVRNELENFMFANGADSLAFGSIVASGPNTANPHAVPSDRVIEKGDFVLMDYGAGYCDYRSDMTRTVVMGEPTQEQLDLYALVRRTHEECVAAIHPGVEGNDIFKLSKKIIGDAGYGDYYNHGLGHGVGIDIHELPNLNRSKNIIEVGSVITMEPGVYLPGVGGVRLEDYGVVTENGYEPFTKTPHDLHVIDC